MELEECIKDALEFSMKSYIGSEDYIQKQQQITYLWEMAQNAMPIEQRKILVRLSNAIDVCNGSFAAEAYMHGVVDGVILKGRVNMN